jgi:hypothetical protein
MTQCIGKLTRPKTHRLEETAFEILDKATIRDSLRALGVLVDMSVI